MENIISEYQRWKQQGETLRTQAKQAMEGRFRDLLTEAARISQEYQKDFGSVLKPPPPITAFRFKPAGVKAVKKTASAPVSTSNPKIVALEKKLAQTRTKLEATKAA